MIPRAAWNRWAGIAILMLALASVACQRAQPVSSALPDKAVASVDLLAEGDSRYRREDFAGALEAYQTALQKSPEDPRLRYRAAAALASLGRREEAVAAFTWVVEHGTREHHEEVLLARQWLSATHTAPVVRGARTSISPTVPVEPTSVGQVQGNTAWKQLDSDRAAPQLQLLLVGEGGATQGRRYGARVALNEPYRFTNIQAGEYRLMGQVGMIRLWDVKVRVQDGQPTVLDLTEANTMAKPDALRAPPS
jgi:tetratricopeptide (TPR) repeat protein